MVAFGGAGGVIIIAVPVASGLNEEKIVEPKTVVVHDIIKRIQHGKLGGATEVNASVFVGLECF